jgi:DNA-directed RNA polymerase specialized sigma24 family protein
VLEAAQLGDLEAVSRICDHHGAALYNIARALVIDPPRAESVVVDVVARACADPGATAATATGSLRRELARLTYLYSCRWLAEAEKSRAEPALESMAMLSRTAHQQRAAIALVRCGDHTVHDVAELLGLPLQAVAMLLTSGLRELEMTGTP